MNNKLISQKPNYNIDILIVSCDKYSDVWPLFFDNFFKFWKNCPLNIYLTSNNKSFNYCNVINLNTGKDISWSFNLKKALDEIKNKYVLLIMDDLIINKEISETFFKRICDWVDINKPNHLRLHLSNKPKKYDNFVGKLPMKAPYKISLMPSIWNKTFLYNILDNSESAWILKLRGTKRAFNEEGFFSLYKNFIFCDNSIIKGKWQRSMIGKLKMRKISRPIMKTTEQFNYDLKVSRSKLFNMLPNFLKLKLKRFSK